jgi:CDP-glucose 4,6-dehydratase
LRGYVETDPLGGDDPYSASKAAADLATQSWIKSFATSPVAIARAGNVIGGGDWAADRIIPDLVTAYSSSHLPTLRNPNAIRPWQHVLDCLNGYQMLVNKMLTSGAGGEWNFGPSLEEKHTVGELTTQIANHFGITGSAWNLDSTIQPHEAGYLLLDSSKARVELDWSDRLNFNDSIKWSIGWYKDKEIAPLEKTKAQIQQFFQLTKEAS